MFRIAILILLALLSNCSSNTHELKVTSSYAGNVDSLIFNVNFKQVSKLENIPLSLDTTLTFSSQEISSNHDVIVSATLYNNGRKIDSTFSFNDLGYIPKKTVIHINDSLKLKLISMD